MPAVVLALGALAACAPGAAGHSGTTTGVDYRSTVISAPPGVEARVVGGDDRIALRRTGEAPVVVLGYTGEPTFRLDVTGVWRNDASPSVRLDEVRQPDAELARELSGAVAGEPVWRRVSSGRAVTWHDHRAHWMGSSAPAAVRAEPGRDRQLFDWSIPLLVDGERTRVRGSVAYVAPPPAAAWWASLAAAIAAGAALVAVVVPPSGLLRAAAAATSIGAGAGALVVVTTELDAPGGTLDAIGAGAAVVAPAAVALTAAWRLRAADAVRALPLLLAVVLLVVLQLGGRLADTFGRGVLPAIVPEAVLRPATLVAAAAGVTAAAAATRLLWRLDGRSVSREPGIGDRVPATRPASGP